MKKETATALFFIRMFSSIGFAILFSSLTLYLIKNLHFSNTFAVSMMGVFLALHYSLSLVTGLITGRWISYINALILGIAMQMLSLILIYHADGSLLFWGCGLFLSGSMVSMTAINMMITERFEAKEQGRERVFLWNYAGQNLGNILGFSIAGYFQILNNFSNIMYSAIGLMAIALLLGLYFRKNLSDIHTSYTTLKRNDKFFNTIKLLVIVALITFISSKALYYSVTSSEALFVILGLAFILLIGYNFFNTQIRKRAIIFGVLALSYLVFWSLYFLIPTGLTLFVNYSTTSKLFGFLIPPAWLLGINGFLIIFGAPVLASLFKRLSQKREFTAVHKFSAGLSFMAIAFALPVCGIILAHFGLVNLLWVAAAYVFLTFSELFIAPIGLATVGEYVDRKNQNIMSGLCLSIVGFGGLISSKLSNLVTITKAEVHHTNHQFFMVFLLLAIVAIVCSCGLYSFKALYLRPAK